MNKIRMFTSWMGTKLTDGFFELYAEDLLTLTRDQFNGFRQADLIRMMGKTSSPPPGHTAPMMTLSGFTKRTVTSESQAALNTFKKGTKGDASAYPTNKNDLYFDIFTSWLLSKPKVLMMLLTHILILMVEISMINNSLKKNNLLYILYWLLLSRETRKRTSQGF